MHYGDVQPHQHRLLGVQVPHPPLFPHPPSAQYALQRNWYPDPIQVITQHLKQFSPPGSLFLPVMERHGRVLAKRCCHRVYGQRHALPQQHKVYTDLRGKDDLLRYSSVVHSSLRQLDSLLLAYGPQPSYDDMAWLALNSTQPHINPGLVWLTQESLKSLETGSF